MPAINLMPPPAFEKSLVPAFQTNFNRIRDAFLRTSNRIFMDYVQLQGPWPKSYVIEHPFKSDIMINWGGSFWVSSLGVAGLSVQIDGTPQGGWAIMFHNEANSHRYIGSVSMARGIAAGTHTWTIYPQMGAVVSDANDYGHIGVTMHEVTN